MKLKSLSNKDRYGNMFSVEFFEPDTSVPMLMMIPEMPDGYNGADTSNHPGEPKGTDTVPAWLTPGENVVNAEASRIPGNQEKIDAMNEQGRQIQKAQGGPIPTYAAGGDLIQGVTDFFTMPKAPPGIEYRRMPDGSIGKFTEKTGTGGGQTYLGKLEDSKPKRSSRGNTWDFSSLYNYGGGNIPPVYAFEGTLADFLRAEEGLSNKAYLDPAGVPTIGYGSTYGVKMGDKLSDAEANQQLMQDIAVVEDDYNKLVDVDLNPNQQKAVKSLLFNIGGPQFANSRARAALNAGDFDTFQKEASEFRMAGGEVLPGLEARRAREMELFQTPYATADADTGSRFSLISSAQAADDVSDAEMLDPSEPPKSEEEGFLSPQVKRFLMYPLESFGVPVPEDAPGKPVGNQLFGTESNIIKEEQAERALMYPGEFLGIPAPVDAPGVPLPNVFDLLPDADQRMATINQTRVDELKQEEQKLADRINENQSKGIPVSPELVAAHKESTSNLQKAEQIQQQHASEIGAKVTAEAKATEEAQSYNTKTGEFDKPTGKENPEAQKEALSKAAESGKEQPNPSENPSAETQMLLNLGYTKDENGNWVEPKDEEVPDEIKGFRDQAVDAFKGAFGDLFNPKELARMALLYTGSRLMGYDHDASFGYSAKTYINRINAAEEQYQKDIRDDDYQDFTEESRKEFERTRDYSVLEKKPAAPLGVSGTAGTKYDRNTGKIVQVYTMGEGANKRLVVNDNGTLIPATSNRFEVVQAETHNLAKVTDRFQNALQSKMEEVNKAITDKEGKPLDFSTEELAQESANFYNTTRQLFRMDVNASQRLRSEILGAQADYMEAMRLHAEGKGDKPTSIEGFYNRRIINLRTGRVISFSDVKNTDVEKLADLENQLMTLARNEAAEKGTDAGEVYRKYWKDAKDDWSRMKSKGSFTSGKTPGYDPFIAWVQATIINDPDALKLSEESNLKK